MSERNTEKASDGMFDSNNLNLLLERTLTSVEEAQYQAPAVCDVPKGTPAVNQKGSEIRETGKA